MSTAAEMKSISDAISAQANTAALIDVTDRREAALDKILAAAKNDTSNPPAYSLILKPSGTNSYYTLAQAQDLESYLENVHGFMVRVDTFMSGYALLVEWSAPTF